jgi:hypothetical protein
MLPNNAMIGSGVLMIYDSGMLDVRSTNAMAAFSGSLHITNAFFRVESGVTVHLPAETRFSSGSHLVLNTGAGINATGLTVTSQLPGDFFYTWDAVTSTQIMYTSSNLLAFSTLMLQNGDFPATNARIVIDLLRVVGSGWFAPSASVRHFHLAATAYMYFGTESSWFAELRVSDSFVLNGTLSIEYWSCVFVQKNIVLEGSGLLYMHGGAVITEGNDFLSRFESGHVSIGQDGHLIAVQSDDFAILASYLVVSGNGRVISSGNMSFLGPQVCCYKLLYPCCNSDIVID